MKRRVRVLSIVNDVAHGGDEHRLLSFARHVDSERFDHRIAVIKASDARIDASYGSLRPEYEAAGIPLIELGRERPGDGVNRNLLRRLPRSSLSFMRTVGQLARLARSLEVDVVDGHIGTGNQAAVAVGAIIRRPVAVTTYHAEVFRPHWLWYPVQQGTLRGAAAIVTDSEQRADAMRRFLRRPRATITIIPNGVSAERPRRPAAEVAAEVGIPEEPDRIVIGQIAGMVPSKGWATLIEAAALVVAREPRAFFLCVGHSRYDPGFRPRLRDRVEQLGIADRVRFVSYPGHNADVWQLFDIHVHASHFDSLPNAIIEGMAYGKPAVVTDVGDCARAVANEVSGLVVAPGDAAQLAQALLRLVQDRKLRDGFGREARRRYEDRHRPEVMTSHLEALFERLAAV